MKRPKRKPDFIILTKDSPGDDWSELLEVWFKEFTMIASTVFDYKKRSEKYSIIFYNLDRFESKRGRVMWAFNEEGEPDNYWLYSDDDFVATDVQQKLETAYKDWLVTKELEKMLKAKTKLKKINSKG